MNKQNIKNGMIACYWGKGQDSTYIGVYETLDNAVSALRSFFHGITHSASPMQVCLYELVVEDNGFVHEGKLLEESPEWKFYN